MYTCIGMCVYIYIYTYIYLSLSLYIYIYMYTYIYLSLSLSVYLSLSLYIYIYIYIYVYIYHVVTYSHSIQVQHSTKYGATFAFVHVSAMLLRRRLRVPEPVFRSNAANQMHANTHTHHVIHDATRCNTLRLRLLTAFTVMQMHA